jgi:hypothetical protein
MLGEEEDVGSRKYTRWKEEIIFGLLSSFPHARFKSHPTSEVV